MTKFEDEIADPTRGYAIDYAGSEVGMVAFGGIGGGMQVPPFEFFSMARGMNVTKIFVRDLRQCWYADGVPGLGEDLREISASLMRISQELRFTPVFFGVSAGGFAASAAALLTGAPTAHVFSLQSTLRRHDRLLMRDFRWQSNIRRFRRAAAPIDDIRELLRGNKHTEIQVHVAGGHRLDLAHATRIEGHPGVTVHRHRSGGHGLVRDLRDDGTLATLVADSLSTQASTLDRWRERPQ